MATLNMRLSAPSILIDINALAGLDGIEIDGGELRIGALVRHTALGASDLVARHAPLVNTAAPHIAHMAIRNRGTVGGSIAFADPAAELPACLLAHGGAVEVTGMGGSRAIEADKFFKGLYETDMAADEMVTGITVPAANGASRFGFAEIARRHGDYALVGLAAQAQQGGDSGLSDIRLAYFGVGEVPVRARNAEASLAGGDMDAAVSALADDLSPFDDIHAPGAVRLHLAGVLLRRVVRQMEDGNGG